MDGDSACTSWLDATEMPSASPPDTDQPAAPVPGDETGLSNSTRMVSSETAVALRIDGCGATVRLSGERAASGFPLASTTADTSSARLPVAPGSAAAPPNETVWVSVPFPSKPATGLGSPPESSETDM